MISKHKISDDFCDRLKKSDLTYIYLLATISFSEKADFSIALCQELLSLSYPKYKNTVKCTLCKHRLKYIYQQQKTTSNPKCKQISGLE